MAPSESDIRSLITNTSYTASSISPLEEYLKLCCEGNIVYIFDAIRTLVKLYQLFPMNDVEATKNIRNVNIGYACMLALLEYPNSTDLLALSYLIPQTVTLKEPCSSIFKCSEHLKSCHFSEFWKVYTSSLVTCSDPIIQQLATKSIGLMQQSILTVLALSYKIAPTPVVMAACNVPSNLEAITKSSTVVDSITSDSVVFKATPDNTKRQRVYQEGVSFTTISSLLQKMAQ